MTQQFKLSLLTMLVGGAICLAPAAKADEWNKETILTFNEAVEIPGTVLQPGTYVFKLADTESDRDIVQVFTGDEKQLLATIMAIPDYRDEPSDGTVVTFEERPSGTPEALHSWFYPGDTDGLEFVYPKSDQQIAVAQPEQSTAPTFPSGATPEQPANQPPTVLDEEEQQVIIAQTTTPAEATDDSGSNEAQTTDSTTPDSLPKTAGNFAEIPLLGMALLGCGWGVIRLAPKQS